MEVRELLTRPIHIDICPVILFSFRLFGLGDLVAWPSWERADISLPCRPHVCAFELIFQSCYLSWRTVYFETRSGSVLDHYVLLRDHIGSVLKSESISVID